MNEPRPAMISARPPEIRSTSAKRWKTRTGSSELSTVTALESLIRSVTAAIAARATSGAWVLPTAEPASPALLREPGLLQQVLEALLRADAGAEVGKGGKTEFEVH